MRLLAVFATDKTLSDHCGLKSLAKDWLRCSLSKSKCPSPALGNCEGRHYKVRRVISMAQQFTTLAVADGLLSRAFPAHRVRFYLIGYIGLDSHRLNIRYRRRS